MTGLDTNVIIRFLVNDNQTQGKIVRNVLQQAEQAGKQFHISNVVVLECIYVLDSVYKLSRQDILDAFAAMLHMSVFVFENPDIISTLVSEGIDTAIDLEDMWIGLVSRAAGCDATLTFDKRAARSGLFQSIV